MHESQQFDLHSVIQTLIKGEHPYTEIILLSITPKLLHFKVKKALKNKQKTFKIICKPNQAIHQTQILIKSMSFFLTRRIMLSCAQVTLLSSNKQAQQVQQLSKLLAKTLFDEILIQDEVIHIEILLKFIFQKYTTSKITFIAPIPIVSAAQITTWLHSDLHQQNIILSFQVEEPNNGELLKFAKAWINSIPSQKYLTPKRGKTFGYPFPLQAKSLNYFGRKQQISLKIRNKQLVTTRQLQQEGRFFIISGKHHIKILEELILILFSDGKGVSLEIGPLQGEELVSIAQYAVMNFSGGYRLIIGHQLELSICRMVLNTVDLTSDQIKRMMRIGAESGRYEIAMYSEINYFQMALSLFMAKPLIKFNFFFPIEQWNSQTQILINRIEEQCKRTKKNVYSYSALLKRYANFGYVFVNQVFHTLALEY